MASQSVKVLTRRGHHGEESPIPPRICEEDHKHGYDAAPSENAGPLRNGCGELDALYTASDSAKRWTF